MKTCARCGAQNVEDAAFCANCGSAFETAGTQPGEAAPEAPQPPYVQPPYAQPPYAQPPAGPYTQPPPGYGYPPQAPMPGAPYPQYAPYRPMVRTSNSKATASLVLGIIGILIFPFICSVLAIILGALGKKEIEASAGWQTGDSNATVGIILGVAGLVLWVVGLIIWNAI